MEVICVSNGPASMADHQRGCSTSLSHLPLLAGVSRSVQECGRPGGGERVEFHVWFRIDGLGGELVVDVSQRVVVTDTLLRM